MKQFDVFVLHAWEDKAEVARPLAELLKEQGYRVWCDEMSLKVGDSLRESVDTGLSSSRYGVVILSPSFFARKWPMHELHSLVQLEVGYESKRILPIWHKLDLSDVRNFSPSLANKFAILSTLDIEELCRKIQDVVGTPNNSSSESSVSMQVEATSSPNGAFDKCSRCGKKGYYVAGGGHLFFECPHCGYETLA